jgi:hypothetical protein
MDHEEERRKNIAEWEMFQTGKFEKVVSISNAPGSLRRSSTVVPISHVPGIL